MSKGWLVASQKMGLPRVLPGGGLGPGERGPLGGAKIEYHHGDVMDLQVRAPALLYRDSSENSSFRC